MGSTKTLFYKKVNKSLKDIVNKKLRSFFTIDLDVVIAIEFGVRLVVLCNAKTFVDYGNVGSVDNCCSLNDIKIARDVNGAVDWRSLKFR